MKLWRIDAEHESGDGSYTLLYRDPQQAELHACRYSQAVHGWLIDIYDEEAGELDAQSIERLCNHLWPIMPIAELVALVNQPVEAAREQLDTILAKRKGVA